MRTPEPGSRDRSARWSEFSIGTGEAVERENHGTAPEGLAMVGPDRDAVAPGGDSEILYDFGLGRVSGSFGIRTARADLRQILDAHLGAAWADVLGAVGGDLRRASPTWVVRNPIGRIEVSTPIPEPGGASSPGPHTHVLPDLIEAGGELPPNLTLPSAYVPCFVHYPARQAALLTDGHEAESVSPWDRG